MGRPVLSSSAVSESVSESEALQRVKRAVCCWKGRKGAVLGGDGYRDKALLKGEVNASRAGVVLKGDGTKYSRRLVGSGRQGSRADGAFDY